MSRPVRVAVVGYGWMGEVHARAYLRLRHHYPHGPFAPELAMVAEADADRGALAVGRYGFAATTTRWMDVIDDPSIGVVSVTAPNSLHRQIGVAVAEAGKHLWIEKPVGLSADDARAVATAVRSAGVQAAVGFNYRNAPAVELAARLIADGEIGRVTNARVRLFSDYAAHPMGALGWRFERRYGGAGVLGDLVSHAVDLTRYLLGEIDQVVADTAIFITERPRATGAADHFAVGTTGELGPVENEDFLNALLRMRNGARVSLESSRVSVGDQCNYGVEVHGTKGSLAWDFRRMGELQVSSGDEYLNQYVRTVYAAPGHGDYAHFQPGAGVSMSYDDLKVIEAARLFDSIAAGQPIGATIEDAVHSASALDAMSESARTGQWVTVS
jgi:predicted dehydrogenase